MSLSFNCLLQLDKNCIKIYHKWGWKGFVQNHLAFNREYCLLYMVWKISRISLIRHRIAFTKLKKKYKNKNKVAHSSQTRDSFSLFAPHALCCLMSSEPWNSMRLHCWGFPRPNSLGLTWVIPGVSVGAEACRAMLSLLWRINSLLTLKWSLIRSSTSWLQSLTWSKMLIMFLFNMIYRTSVTAGESYSLQVRYRSRDWLQFPFSTRKIWSTLTASPKCRTSH